MVKIIIAVLALVTAGYAYVFFRDYIVNKSEAIDKAKFVKCTAVGFFVNFMDTLGIGSFAISTVLLRWGKLIKDRLLPGTLNTGNTIPTITEALIFITIIQVDIVTLIFMIGSAVLGAFVGAKIVAHLPEKKVQAGMGVALLAAAFFMLSGKLGLMPAGGTESGLVGMKLAIGVSVNFILGMLMTLGIGLYAPCMALVFALGMDPKMAFPIMMGSCAFLMPVAGIRFIKEKAHDKTVSLGLTLGGVPGVLVAAFIVKSLSLEIMKWLVIVVIVYTSLGLIRAALKNTDRLRRDNIKASLDAE